MQRNRILEKTYSFLSMGAKLIDVLLILNFLHVKIPIESLTKRYNYSTFYEFIDLSYNFQSISNMKCCCGSKCAFLTDFIIPCIITYMDTHFLYFRVIQKNC